MLLNRRTLLLCLLLLFVAFSQAAEAAPKYAIRTLASFDGVSSGHPAMTNLIFDATGDIYGTTHSGGEFDGGTLFRFNPNQGELTTLHSFPMVYSNRSTPLGLAIDSNGDFYGVTVVGGTESAGTVFKWAASTSELNTLVSFNGTNGRYPSDRVIIDSSGNLYGTTHTDFQPSNIYRVAAGSGSLTTLRSFPNGTKINELAIDSAGILYGTTRNGGEFGYGTVFRLDSQSGALTTLATFDGSNGRDPYSGVILDDDGILYGTTHFGGDFPGPYNLGLGTVFKLDPATGTLETMMSFDDANGSSPWAKLVFGPDGNLYGTTSGGGDFPGANNRGLGTLFRIDPVTKAFETLFSFDGTNGESPLGNLTLGEDGALYGTTQFGGAHGVGTIFKLAVVPEPGTAVLLFGVVALCGAARRNRQNL